MTSEAVKTLHRDYQCHMHKWQKVRHAISGDLIRYLRDVGKNEPDPKYGAARQAEYEEGAIVYNFTKRTLAGMVGAVMRKDAEQIIPSKLEYLLKNCDGSGIGLIQHAQDTLTEIDSVGRGGLLADAPEGAASTMAEQNAGKLNPVIAWYTAENIINWRFERTGSINKLVMVVLREPFEYFIDGNEFQPQCGEQYRVLDIVGGKYRQRIWQFGDASIDSNKVTEIFPKLGNLPVDEIPFTFIGATNNDATIDDAPLLPLSELQIGHFRNSADSEENIFVTGQVMLTISPGGEMTPTAWNDANPNGVKFGARAGLNLGTGGTAALLQANASTAARQGMLDKELQAVQIGAQLITPTQQITAESARLQRGADTSVMATISNNVSEAYTQALKWVAGMMGISEGTEIEFKLNTEFFLQQMTAQDRAAWMVDINAGLLPATAYYAALRAAGVTDWTDEEIEDGIAVQMPTKVQQTTNDVTGEIPASAVDSSGQQQQQEQQEQNDNGATNNAN